MNKVISLIFRQMRRPLIALILAYAISILGMVWVPGVDADGNPYHMSFFHAFYFVSFTATTIGFGEIPYTLTDAQRMWALVSIYLSVVAWLYAIGKILTLIQDPAFRQAATEMRFVRAVERMDEPFYLVCGYGDTGSSLLRAFSERHLRAVVIDPDQQCINNLSLKDYTSPVPGLCADAANPDNLIKAGLQRPNCTGVIALTSSDTANLKIAITSKLLNPGNVVVCRADHQDVNKNMASFGTDYIVDAFETFADSLEMAMRSPSIYLLYDWLTGVPDTLARDPLYPPKGTWVLCGFGRFGKAVYRRLRAAGIKVNIIEQEPSKCGCPDDCFLVEGRGTEADTLLAAGIMKADAIIAGTDDDSTNLSILMTAIAMKPDLFVVARQNLRSNETLFKAIHVDMIMQHGGVISRRVRILLATPLMEEFLQRISVQDSAWANILISRIAAVIGDILPHLWTIKVASTGASALFDVIRKGRKATLRHILTDPRRAGQQLACIPLMLVRNDQYILTPNDDTPLQEGDRILFCGPPGLSSSMETTLRSMQAVNYIMTGDTGPDGIVWRWLEWRRSHRDRRELPRVAQPGSENHTGQI